MESWHSVPPEEALRKLGAPPEGLSEAEAAGRLQKYGPNELRRKKGAGPLGIFLGQFRNPLVYLLIAASAAAFLVGEALDAAMIFGIVLLNAILGFVQDWRAERAIEALSAMFIKKAKVLRGGTESVMESRLLVPGDVILLEAGDEVPADARVLDAADLQVSEASLTGESMPVRKGTGAVPAGTILPERTCMVYAGTMVMNGWAEAVVAETGMATELGKIAELTQATGRRKTHVEETLEGLAKKLGILFLALSAAAAATGILMGRDALEMLLLGVSLAVAAVPEGLPAVVTITLALGLQRLGKVKTLVRRLPATETLGAITFICTDKTGTLTKNEMTVTKAFVGGKEIEVGGAGYSTDGSFSERPPSLQRLLEIAALCNHAAISGAKPVGDPTEVALLVAAAKGGLRKENLDREHHILHEVSFSMERKMMSVVTRNRNGVIVNTKGAPEMVLRRCTRMLAGGKVRPLGAREKAEAMEENERLAAQGYRVLGFAYRECSEAETKDPRPETLERELVYAGSMAIIDPIRPEAKEAIETCRRAGIKVAMVTGDHKSTAIAIARQVGLFDNGSLAVDSEGLDALSEGELAAKADRIRVYARVTPEQKMRVLAMLQGRGEIVAMTGDGVNDAPALKKADVGIAMGVIGTDVARETAEVVLADDNFASIVNGIAEGRGIYLNIRKFVYYLLSSNLAEVLIVFLAMVLGWPLILLPVQLLWINLVTDGITALSLGVDPTPKDIMRRPPRNPKEEILGGRITLGLLGLALVKTALILFIFGTLQDRDQDVARTMAFVGLVFAETWNLFNFRSLDLPLHRADAFSNRWLLLSIVAVLALTMVVVQVPALASLFHLVPLSALAWGWLAVATMVVLAAGEIYKNVAYIAGAKRNAGARS